MPKQFDTHRTACGRGRVSYRPDWSAQRPWASYLDGTAGRHFTDLDEARAHYLRLGLQLKG